MNYEHFESLNSTSTLPFTSTAINIKGVKDGLRGSGIIEEFAATKWTRTGPEELVLPDKAVSAELDKILRLSPYRERGIAVFSSLVLRVPRFKEHFWDGTLKEIVDWGLKNWIGTPFRNYKGLGMFIEEEDCSAMEQKMNCSVLAACRGQMIQEPPSPIGELIPLDPCADLPMVTLSVSESSASFRFEPNTSYRLRLDGVDMETAKSVIIWKVGGDAVHAYEPTKRCQEQEVAVHANGADLILIEVNATQVVGHVIEAFTGRHRFRIHFLVDSKEDEPISDHRIAIQIAGIIGEKGPKEPRNPEEKTNVLAGKQYVRLGNISKGKHSRLLYMPSKKRKRFQFECNTCP
ncbi:hypothetical protein ANCDUO_07253 [Ancylostoma duodenale]|uniref:Uncharacterized protein n=1 Tax=Ancylostoma duodenale TaxID=51022 RepID=A0A0C2GZC1_9BILA|nr:hypothetical protein ANCDUO_07253 [Ancylostoma duodenale]